MRLDKGYVVRYYEDRQFWCATLQCLLVRDRGTIAVLLRMQGRYSLSLILVIATQKEAGVIKDQPVSDTEARIMSKNIPEEIRGAIARGWCSKKNSHKEMDADLADAIAWEVFFFIEALRAKLEACENELAEMDASFELYDQSIRELTAFYHKEHPKEKEERRYPRTSKLVAWAVATIERERKYKRRAIEIAREALGIRPECEHDTPGICPTCRARDLFTWGERSKDRRFSELKAMEKDGGENV